ncbi:flippase [Pseudacidobacterium ailaaui]|uniref:flippase n=1 Tax=Pseudacidobacterium ailaaui TaxID=1382359 RepID=UPI00138E5649|nr:flippase [Pseudacidobacterium ailaaui]
MLKEKLRNLMGVAAGSALLAIGEGSARICTMLTLILVSRKFGVSTLGSLALAQTMAIYIALGIDAGARHIGARLIAAWPDKVTPVRQRMQAKRKLLALIAVPLGLIYAIAGPIPQDARLMVSLYALAVAPYCLSLDWVLWGAKRYGSLSMSRALISVLSLAALVLAVFFGADPRWAIPVAAGIGYAGSAAYSRWQTGRTFQQGPDRATALPPDIVTDTRWKAVLVLGAALACNQAFNNIDSLLLGALTNLQQVGLYNSAYRLLTALLGVYYLLTTSLYPRIAEVSPENRSGKKLRSYLVGLFLAGTLPALLVMHFSRKIIVGIYGQNFAQGAPMVAILILALPLDFVTSFCGVTLVAWGMSRRVLIATASAAAVNIGANFYLIPRYGGLGASWATLISYMVLLVIMLAMLPWQTPASRPSAVVKIES